MNAEERAKNLIVSIENDSTDEVVNRIAQALRDAERDTLEWAAKVADARRFEIMDNVYQCGYDRAAYDIAVAIRALKDAP